MKLIEFVGCEGIGKTSIYNGLMRYHTPPQKRIISESEADHLIARNFLKRHNSNFKYSIGIRLPVIKRLVHQEILKREVKKELYKYKKQWEHCIRILFTNHSNSNLTLRSSLYSYAALLSKIEKQALYENDGSDHLVILEPGVFHKLNNILMYFKEEDLDQVTVDIFSGIPVIPYALVYFKASPELIYERFCGREGERDLWMQDFKDFSKELTYPKILLEQKIIDAGVKVLKSRGANIVEIDANIDIDTQFNTVKVFLDKMS